MSLEPWERPFPGLVRAGRDSDGVPTRRRTTHEITIHDALIRSRRKNVDFEATVADLQKANDDLQKANNELKQTNNTTKEGLQKTNDDLIQALFKAKVARIFDHEMMTIALARTEKDVEELHKKLQTLREGWNALERAVV